jgi:anti-sigma B factor antagonist
VRDDGSVAGSLEVVVEGSVDEPRLVLQGEVDLSSIVTLRTVVAGLARQPPPVLLIDLTQVGFMDSTGLGWLAQLARDGCRVTLHGTPRAVRQALRVTGLDEALAFAGDP